MLLYVICLILGANVICWLVRLLLTARYMDSRQKDREDDHSYHGIHPVVLIPVLNEEKRVHSCIENCIRLREAGPITVVFATSCREHTRPGMKNTIDVIRDYQAQYPWIKSYQCPIPGVMAHQLNHAIKAFHEETPSRGNMLYILYNVDSVMTVSSIAWVCKQYCQAKDKNVIYQQYGCYTKNIQDIRTQPLLARSILMANMLWQTRWSVGFEIPHALMGQGAFISGNAWMLNYCIGHGLFFNDEVYRIVGGFEEHTLNEDAMFGLQACLNNIRIIPVSELELADSPDLVGSLYRQKTTWIYGPAQAFTYRRLILSRKSDLSGMNRIRLFVLSVQLFEHSLRWILVPLMIAAGFFTCFHAPLGAIALFLLILAAYLGGLDLLCMAFVPRDTRLSFFDMAAILIGAVIQFEMHGISGIIGFAKLLYSRITGAHIRKGKTEMKQ